MNTYLGKLRQCYVEFTDIHSTYLQAKLIKYVFGFGFRKTFHAHGVKFSVEYNTNKCVLYLYSIRRAIKCLYFAGWD